MGPSPTWGNRSTGVNEVSWTGCDSLAYPDIPVTKAAMTSAPVLCDLLFSAGLNCLNLLNA